ncbi:hypothetical protein QUB63_31555 [Microcoleus sp. ARI1-B5]
MENLKWYQLGFGLRYRAEGQDFSSLLPGGLGLIENIARYQL